MPRELGQLHPRNEINYVKQNYKNIANEHSRPVQTKPDAPKPRNYGKVPEYLNKFNKQRDEEVRQR